MKRQPALGQAVKWCVCGEWFASERDERDHIGRCPGPMRADCNCGGDDYGAHMETCASLSTKEQS